ncbi:transcription initiation from RNA polymerase II promoter [Neofusicoccum ribis]|uniref:Transcription initiation from RNA polymerase II promoter n=1 Tax=Neofusicoccum ribis TaxID=45134 RepID=A0ABR3T6A0_9PEZI
MATALDELPAILPQLAEKIRQHFDREIVNALRSRRVIRKRMNFKARCHTYRFCDDRWYFMLKDVKVKTDSGRSIKADWVTIDAVSTGLEEERRMLKELRAGSKSKKKR